MMNPINRKIPRTDARMAFTSNVAMGPSCANNLKVKSIAQPKAVLRPTLRTVLRSDVSADVLISGEAVAQSTGESARSKASNLIHLREILTAGCKSKIAAQTAVQGKADASRARRNPIDAAAGKAAPRAGEGQCPSPLFWEVVELADSQRQDVRALIPQPFLLVRSFQSLYILVLKTKAMPVFEKGFILGNHAIIVGRRPADT